MHFLFFGLHNPFLSFALNTESRIWPRFSILEKYDGEGKTVTMSAYWILSRNTEISFRLKM